MTVASSIIMEVLNGMKRMGIRTMEYLIFDVHRPLALSKSNPESCLLRVHFSGYAPMVDWEA